MDYLWSPWRYRYVTKAEAEAGCVFCTKPAQKRDPENFILHRGEHCYVLLNLYPYISGHMMVVPYDHVAMLPDLPQPAAAEMMSLTTLGCRCLSHVYRPGGINLGMNLGECAGAGIAGHLHMHLLPRWPGDSNFMTVIGETRVLPEDMETTYAKLKAAFGEV